MTSTTATPATTDAMSVDLSTWEDFDAWARRTPPARPDRIPVAEYERMSPSDRNAYNVQRRRWHAALPEVDHARWDTIGRELRTRLLRNEFVPPERVRQGIAISGDAGVGKSHRIRRALANIHLENPLAGTRVGGRLVLPVCYVELAGPIQPKSLCGSILRYYGQVDVPGDLTRWIEAVIDVVNKCGTTVIALDEAQHVAAQDNHGRKSFDVIKTLMNRTSATVVVSGIKLRDAGIFDASKGQTAAEADRGESRFDMHDMTAYSRRKEDALGWRELLVEMEDQLVLLRSRPGDLTDIASWLVNWTGGSLRGLSELLNAGALYAVHSQGATERLTKELLRSVPRDARATRLAE